MLVANTFRELRLASLRLHAATFLRQNPAPVQIHAQLASKRVTELRLGAECWFTQAPQCVKHGADINAELVGDLEDAAWAHELHDGVPSRGQRTCNEKRAWPRSGQARLLAPKLDTGWTRTPDSSEVRIVYLPADCVSPSTASRRKDATSSMRLPDEYALPLRSRTHTAVSRWVA